MGALAHFVAMPSREVGADVGAGAALRTAWRKPSEESIPVRPGIVAPARCGGLTRGGIAWPSQRASVEYSFSGSTGLVM
jgi:hypothetical protein